MTQHTRNLINTAVRIGTTAGACAIVILCLAWFMPAHSEFWLICAVPLAAVSVSQFSMARSLKIKGEIDGTWHSIIIRACLGGVLLGTSFLVLVLLSLAFRG